MERYTDENGVTWRLYYDLKSVCADRNHSWEVTTEWDWDEIEPGLEVKNYFPCWTCRNCSAYQEPDTHHDWDLLYPEY